jgi:hypothetical protein
MTRAAPSTDFGAGGARSGAAALMGAFSAAGWPSDAPPKAAAAVAKPKGVAKATPQEVWHYSWEGAGEEEEEGPPAAMPGGTAGPSLAARIRAVVASHEPDARAHWRTR